MQPLSPGGGREGAEDQLPPQGWLSTSHSLFLYPGQQALISPLPTCHGGGEGKMRGEVGHYTVLGCQCTVSISLTPNSATIVSSPDPTGAFGP